MSRYDANSTLVIFDWDDTLFPTTYLNEKRCIKNNVLREVDTNYQIPKDVAKKLTDFETICLQTLENAWKLSNNNLVVVTNGDDGWVIKSGYLFLRKVAIWLKAHNVQIISARSLYESQFPNSVDKWKTVAFMELCRERFKKHEYFNLLSVGDSDYEEIATRHICAVAPNAVCKSTKMVENPNLEQLCHQHFALQKQLETMVKSQQPELFTFAISDEYKRWCDENGEQY